MEDFSAIIDPDFEPQTRQRADTWPLKRPVIRQQKDALNNQGMQLEPTIQEASSQEQIMDEVMENSNNTASTVKVESQNVFMVSGVFSGEEFANGYNASLSEFSGLLMSPQRQSGVVSDTIPTSQTFSNQEPVTQTTNLIPASNFSAVGISPPAEHSLDSKHNISSLNNAFSSDVPQQTKATVSEDAVTTTSAVGKAKTSSRKNAWGNSSYADLITQGIESSPDKRLTLAQIYEWMVKNIPYFKDKGDSNSSAGWKNSIRHNLSLHDKFKRIQNEGTGKSSWWVINYDAKPGKQSRKRATSLDINNHKINKARARAVSKRNEYQKKLKAAASTDSPTWARSPTGADGSNDFEHPLNKQLLSDYRPRTSSNASSLGGRMSPPRSFLAPDLEDDGPPPLSPLPPSYTSNDAFDLFGRNDNFSLLGELDPMVGTSDLLESINIDALSPTSPMSQPGNDSNTNIYLNTATTLQNQLQANSSTTSPVNKHLSGVDVSGAISRPRAHTMPRLQPQPKYDMNQSLRRQQNGETLALSQESLYVPSFNASSSQQNAYLQYPFNGQAQQLPIQQQQQTSPLALPHQPRQPNCGNIPIQCYTPQSQVQQAQQQNVPNNILQVDQTYPPDLNIDNQDIFDPGPVDFDQLMLQDMEPSSTGFPGMELNSFFQQNTDLDVQMDTSSGMASNNNGGSVTNLNASNEYQYPSNQVTMQTMNLQQQSYGQPPPPYSITMEENSSMRLQQAINSSNPGENGCQPQFMSTVSPQSSMPPMNSYQR